MSFFTRSFVLCLAAFAQSTIAGYELQDDYSPSNFFNEFTFFTAPDPTNGFVEYVDQSTAQGAGLISQGGDSIYMGVDHTNMAPNGRQSVRVTSNKAYNHGLIILDLAHMPIGCGTWPAFWMVGPDWPTHGEIDIIEGVNMQTSNAMTLHTGPGCSITNNGLFSGAISTNNCDVNDPNQPTNAGCSIDAPNSETYGAGLNAGQGGVYATEWTNEAISVYYFPRSSVPADITAGKPNPANWGKPDASFQGGCSIDNSVKNQQIVFDTTFCGDWAGGAWGSSECSAKAYSCEDYVANNPSAFKDAYWKINSLKVYQSDGTVSEPSSSGNGPYGHQHHHAPAIPASQSAYEPSPVYSSSTAWASTPVTSAAPIPVTTQNIYTTFVVSVTAGASPAPVSQWGDWSTPVAGYADYAATPTPSVAPQAVTTPYAPATTSYSAPTVQESWFPDGSQYMPEGSFAMKPRNIVRKHARHILKHKRIAKEALGYKDANGRVHMHHRGIHL